MFINLSYYAYNTTHQYNVFWLNDSCLPAKITTPHNSPSLKNTKNDLSNTLTLLSLIRHYKTQNRNVALNLALYYNWLIDSGYDVTIQFISKQFELIDSTMNLNYKLKYFYNTIIYLKQNHKRFL